MTTDFEQRTQVLKEEMEAHMEAFLKGTEEALREYEEEIKRILAL